MTSCDTLRYRSFNSETKSPLSVLSLFNIISPMDINFGPQAELKSNLNDTQNLDRILLLLLISALFTEDTINYFILNRIIEELDNE